LGCSWKDKRLGLDIAVRILAYGIKCGDKFAGSQAVSSGGWRRYSQNFVALRLLAWLWLGRETL